MNKFPPRQRLITNDFTRSDISPCGQRQVIKNADMIKQQRSKLIFGGCAKLTERGRFLYLWDTFPASIQLIVLDVSWPRLKMIAWGGDIRLASKYLALSVHRDNRQRPHQECCLDNTCFVLSTWRQWAVLDLSDLSVVYTSHTSYWVCMRTISSAGCV